jgi:hypothetical protein
MEVPASKAIATLLGIFIGHCFLVGAGTAKPTKRPKSDEIFSSLGPADAFGTRRTKLEDFVTESKKNRDRPARLLKIRPRARPQAIRIA